MPRHSPHTRLPDRLLEAQALLDALGSDFSGIGARLLGLRQRLEKGRSRIAVLGQFKRGKSSLLNALLGEALLPTGVVPLTSIPTVIRHGPERRVRLTFLDGRCEEQTGRVSYLAKTLMASVTERHNPGNRLGIAQAELELPCLLLPHGVEIIDTPGIGSTVLRNTDAARSILPVCDAALFVLSPDPPMTETELQFLRAVKDSMPRIIFVLTKADLLNTSEREETVAFVQKVLHDEAGYSSHERIFLVSTRTEPRAATTDDFVAGLNQFKAHLREFMESEMAAVLPQAIQGKAGRLLGEALFALDLQWKAVALPRQDLIRRSELFEAQLAKIDYERERFGDLLACDLTRFAYHLDQFAATMTTKVRDALVTHANAIRHNLSGLVNARRTDRRVRAALSRELDAILLSAEETFIAESEMQFAAIEETHSRAMEDLVARIRRAAADMFEVPCLEGVRFGRLEGLREPRLVTRRWTSSFLEQALLWSIQWLPAQWQSHYLEERLAEDIKSLATQNVQELRWTAQRNVEEAIRGFQVRMEDQIGETVGAIRMSIWAALARQEERESTGRNPEFLKETRRHLTELLSTLLQREDQSQPGSPI